MNDNTDRHRGLRAEGLSRGFDVGGQRIDVLAEVSLSLQPGESLAVVGPSGSGKSTLLNILAGLDAPDAGRVELDGVDPYALNAKALARFRSRKVGLVFQDHHLLSELTALDNVMLAALAAEDTGPDVPGRAKDLLESVGLGDRLDHRPGQLSGGQRQRVAIARALMNQPSLLLADEPTGNLDARTAETVAEVLTDLPARNEVMLILATHSMDLAGRAGQIRRLVDGALVEPSRT